MVPSYILAESRSPPSGALGVRIQHARLRAFLFSFSSQVSFIKPPKRNSQYRDIKGEFGL